MKRIIATLLFALSINTSYALTSTPTIDAKYDAENCGMKEHRIDTESDDVCHDNFAMNLIAGISPKLIEVSVFLKDTQFKRKYDEIKYLNQQEIEKTDNKNKLTAIVVFDFILDILPFIVALVLFVLTMKSFGEIKFKEYNIYTEFFFKAFGLIVLLPSSVGNMGMYAFGELIIFNEKHNGLMSRYLIDQEYIRILNIEPTTMKDISVKYTYEAAVAPIDTAIYAYSAISQTDKFNHQFIENKSTRLTYDMNDVIKLNGNTILFNRTQNFMTKYNAASIELFPTKTLNNIMYNDYITDNSKDFKDSVIRVQESLKENSKEKSLSVEEINDVKEVLKASYNKALLKAITEIWENDIEVLHQKTLESQCFTQGLGTYSKSYVKKLNGNLPRGEDEGSIFCVEKINGEYVALGADAVLEDVNKNSQKSQELVYNNQKFIIDKKRELAETKIFPIYLDFYEAYKEISTSSTEKQLIKDFASNPTLYAPHSMIALQRISHSDDSSIRDFLNTGLKTSRNNANTNLILESAMNANISETEIIRNLPNLKLRSAVLEIIKENQNVKRIGIETKQKTTEQILEDGDSDSLKNKFFGEATDIYSRFKADAGLTLECINSIGCISSKQDTYLGTLTGFGYEIKNYAWGMLIYGTGFIAAKQTAGYFKEKREAKESSTGKIKETKKGYIKAAFSKLIKLASFIMSALTLLAVPIYFIGLFLAHIIPLMISLPLFVMTLSYNLMYISIFVLGISLFAIFRLLNVNDNNNRADIIKKIFIFPMAMLFAPTLIYITGYLFKYLIFIISYFLLIALIIPFGSMGIVEFVLALFMIVYIIMFVIVSSIAISVNVVDMVYDILGFDKIFTLNITQYAEEVNNIFLKVIPFAQTAANLILKFGFNKKKKR